MEIPFSLKNLKQLKTCLLKKKKKNQQLSTSQKISHQPKPKPYTNHLLKTEPVLVSEVNTVALPLACFILSYCRRQGTDMKLAS